MLTLDAVKGVLLVTDAVFNAEVTSLMNAAKLDLSMHGVDVEQSDELVDRAILTYCRANFGNPSNYDKLVASYKEQKAQLMMCSDYNGGGSDG